MPKIIQSIGEIADHLNKQELIELAEDHVVQILEGEYDDLKVYIALKRYQLYLDTLVKELQKAALGKAKEHGEKSFEYSNCRVLVQHRTKYNYANDDGWNKLNLQFEQLKRDKKEREKLLQAVSGESLEVVDEETGEIDTLTAPQKKVVEQIIIRF